MSNTARQNLSNVLLASGAFGNNPQLVEQVVAALQAYIEARIYNLAVELPAAQAVKTSLPPP